MFKINPIHPGVFIGDELQKHGISLRQLAQAMDVSPSTLQRLITGKTNLSPDMAYRLSMVIGIDALEWLIKQNEYDLTKVYAATDVSKLKRLV